MINKLIHLIIIVYTIMSVFCTLRAEAQVICDRFEIKSTLNGRTISFTLDTDLPDTTNLIVTIGREYTQKKSTDIYAKNYYCTKSTVGGLLYPNMVKVDDEEWFFMLEEHQHKMDSYRIPFEVKSVSDEIFLSITVPLDPMFGKGNELLSGKMMPKPPSLKTISQEVRFFLPYENLDMGRLNKPISAFLSKKSIDSSSALEILKSSTCLKGGTLGKYLIKKISVPAVKDLGWKVSKDNGGFIVIKTFQVIGLSSPTIYKWKVSGQGIVEPLNGHAIGISPK